MSNQSPTLVERAKEHWQLVLTAATALLYGFMHVAYLIFYSRFGLTIGDAGLGLADLVPPTVICLVVRLGSRQPWRCVLSRLRLRVRPVCPWIEFAEQRVGPQVAASRRREAVSGSRLHPAADAVRMRRRPEAH
jgi:hypothetical protein